MASGVRSWKAVHKLYDKLRSRYFMNAEPPLLVPPPAAELTWVWATENAGYLAQIELDEDEDPHTLTIHPVLRKAHRYLTMALLHEMTHMRNPNISCDGKKWDLEVIRLAQLGAIPL